MITLEPLTEDVAVMATEWRNASMDALRTLTPSTFESQRSFFYGLKDSPHKYFSIVVNDAVPVGMTGLTYLTEWSGEVSLLINPRRRGCGFGKAAVDALITHGFDIMDLKVIYGETYRCAESNPFWHHVLERYSPRWVTLPDRRLWKGQLYDSDYFSISRKVDFLAHYSDIWGADRDVATVGTNP
jgi:RimJ/RimL family protein N-acetyltransferase